MKAMLFAAGVGSRLKELTKDTPKCLMQIGGVTILEHVIGRLKAAGVTAVAINVHHHAGKVREFVESRGLFGLDVLFSEESTLLDTGGGLKKVLSFFEGEDAFIIHNSDIFSTADLAALVALHRSRRSIGTLAVLQRPTRRGLYLAPGGELVGWTKESSPQPPGSELVDFSGISVASSELFGFMGDAVAFSLIEPYLAAARSTHRVTGTLIDHESWADIGTPEELEALRAKLSR